MRVRMRSFFLPHFAIAAAMLAHAAPIFFPVFVDAHAQPRYPNT